MTTLSVATHTLAEVADHPEAAIAAVTVLGDPAIDAVVLGRVSDRLIEVVAGGTICTYPDTTAVTDISDPEHGLGLVTAALLMLNAERRRQARQITADGTRHADALREIRDYAIERYREDMYCLDGLNTFLRTFSLPEYQPGTRVSYTIHGSYRTGRTDTEAAEDDANAYLRVDLSNVSYVVDGSADYDVTVDEVEELDC